MQRFKSACSAQKLLSAHTSVHNTFTVKCFSPQFNHIACSAPRRLARGGRALSHELNLAPRNLEVLVRAQAAVAARHVRSASSRRTRSVRREVRWRWTLNVLWTAA